MAETAVAIDLVLQNLEELLGWPFSDAEKRHMGCLREELGMLRSLLKDAEKNVCDEHGEVAGQMRDVVLEAADIIDWSRVSFLLQQEKKPDDALNRIRSMKEEVREMCRRGVGDLAGPRVGVVEGGLRSETTDLLTLSSKLNPIISRELAIPLMCPEFQLELASLAEEIRSLISFVKDAYKNWHHQQQLLHIILGKIKYIMGLVPPSAEGGHIAHGMPADGDDDYDDEDDVAADKKNGFLYPHRPLTDILVDIESIRKIYQTKLHDIRVPKMAISTRARSLAGAASSKELVNEENMVGFNSEVATLKQCLTAMAKQRQVISIVGMAGLGKTTLARNLYNDPFIAYHFYIRGWTYVSQVYRKKDVLLGILSCLVQDKNETFYSMADEKLGEEVYKRLKGNRYLIVLDDMWDIRTWNDLKRYFPNDNNRSRIMLTTRITDVAFDADHGSSPHHLRFLNEDESIDLFSRRVGVEERSHKELVAIGKQIALKCQGLPLAIVVVAGLLARTEKTEVWWTKVADSLSSYIVTDQEQCMDLLTLSYNNLPDHLKSCFLYLGAFPKEYEISARRLTWLWIAEGFVQCMEEKCLEEVAEDYLMELVDRNLVLVAKTKCGGGIRTCRLHDLLHDLCLRKGMEEKFLQQIRRYQKILSTTERDGATHSLYYHSSSCDRLHILYLTRRSFVQVDRDELSASSSIPPPSSSYFVPTGERQRRLCLHSGISESICTNLYAPHVRSVLCCAYKDGDSSSPFTNLSFIYGAFRLLRVLDLSAADVSNFPTQTFGLFLLRYLALKGKHLDLPSSINELQSLETLILLQSVGLSIPATIWKMPRLRHLYIGGENYFSEDKDFGKFSHLKSIDFGSFQIVSGKDCFMEEAAFYSGPSLSNLQTLSQLNPSRRCQLALKRTPNLRKLGLCGRFESRNDALQLPGLIFLNHLETLKLLNRHVPHGHTFNLNGVMFPQNLRRLTLSNTALDWKAVSVVIGELPNLEALKLEFQAGVGRLWETTEGGFPRLKFLRLYYMNVELWNTSPTHFPRLQRLVLHRCRQLNRIPLELGNISTLQTIQVSNCNDYVVSSAMQIQNEQENAGNDSLKILVINSADEPHTNYWDELQTAY